MRNKKSQMPAFGWIFALIVGVLILLLVIFFLSRTISTESKESEIILLKNFDILLTPFSSIGVSGPVSMGKTINLGDKSSIELDCDDFGLGYQTIAFQSESLFGKEGEKIEMNIYDKYIFSEKLSGKSFYVFSKSFELPFRIGDLVYILSKNYCFVNAPDEMKEQIEGIKATRIRFVNESADCLEEDTKVCFSGNCEISVSGERCEGFFCDNIYKYGAVKKQNEEMGFVTDALLYAAIFSDSSLYECNLNRIMNRLDLLVELNQKRIITAECDEGRLNSELYQFKLSLESEVMEQLYTSSQNLAEESSESECPIF